VAIVRWHLWLSKTEEKQCINEHAESARPPRSTTIEDAFMGSFVGGRVRIPNRLTVLLASRAEAKVLSKLTV
jgi:hypothetical protein